MNEKRCTKCGITKPVSEFHKRSDNKTGYTSHCKECRLQHNREYLSKPNTKRLWSDRYKHNKDKLRVYQLNHKYGQGAAEYYYEQALRQNFRCAICGKHASEFEKGLSLDHNHSTGQWRGLLCHHCNTSIGLLNEDTDRLLEMFNYLKQYTQNRGD